MPYVWQATSRTPQAKPLADGARASLVAFLRLLRGSNVPDSLPEVSDPAPRMWFFEYNRNMAHKRSTLLQARLLLVRRDLEEIVDRLTPDLMAWAPAQGMRTISGQLVEIIATEMQLIALLKDGERISDPAAQEIIGDCGNLDNLRRALIDTRQRTLDYLDSLSETDLAEEVPFDGGWLASLTLSTVPRAEIFVNIADHEWYHVGQLTSYLWSRGDNPYSW